MVTVIRANTSTIRKMVVASIYGNLETDMKDNLRTITVMAMVKCIGEMVPVLKVNGSMVSKLTKLSKSATMQNSRE